MVTMEESAGVAGRGLTHEGKAMMLEMWVENQVGVDTDCTEHYIAATGWVPPAGVELRGHVLRGDDIDAVYAAYEELRDLVASVGHGSDEIDAECGAPSLVVCG
jgi:hypothetical protein